MSLHLRETIGRIKCFAFDEWPYRHEIEKISLFREQAKKSLCLLDQVRMKLGETVEVHMLCGKRDLDMGIWASWSLFRFLDGRGRLFVHSDGSLDEKDQQTWAGFIEGISVVEKPQRDACAKDLLATHCPLLHDWRLKNWANAQLIDTHLAATNETILLMDSDVLCFSRPDAVLETVRSGSFGWCGGLKDHYSGSSALLREITGVKLAGKLCAGFMVTPRLGSEDFSELERMLRKIQADGRVNVDHFWSCQTYYALLAGIKNHFTVFPSGYSNCMRKTSSRQVIRHYFGIPSVRFRYFKEGVPRIRKQIE